jgi:hypothetical protein
MREPRACPMRSITKVKLWCARLAAEWKEDIVLDLCSTNRWTTRQRKCGCPRLLCLPLHWLIAGGNALRRAVAAPPSKRLIKTDGGLRVYVTITSGADAPRCIGNFDVQESDADSRLQKNYGNSRKSLLVTV